MRINDDIQDMIAGLAHLGAVYLRISEKVNTFYQENPLLWMEAGSLSKSRGENMGCQDLGEFIEAMVSKSKENPPARHEILFLKRYARKYDDPVLAMETVKEFLGKQLPSLVFLGGNILLRHEFVLYGCMQMESTHVQSPFLQGILCNKVCHGNSILSRQYLVDEA